MMVVVQVGGARKRRTSISDQHQPNLTCNHHLHRLQTSSEFVLWMCDP